MALMESTEEALPGRPTESVPARRQRPRKSSRWVVGIVVAAVLLVTLFAGTALWTDRPEFCATCHEMRPYVDAWAAGPHKNVWCVDCHVGKSYAARFAHKFSALGEVVGHFSGKAKFPMETPPNVADETCVVCHATVTPKLTASGFNHTEHESKAACQACHAETGHAVSQNALTAAGVFNPGVTRAVIGGGTATVGHGSTNVANHVKIACTRCHDMKKTGCAACHALSPKHFKPTSGALPACTQCHKAGTRWVFSHPAKGECANCHAVSAQHFKPAVGPLGACTQCHTQIGKSWAFSHPAPPVDCAKCHAVPAKHFNPSSGSLTPCTQCHTQVGVSWKVAHPGSSANCVSCHTPPSGHSAGQCSQCHHKTGVSFAFSHPNSGAPHGIGGRPCAACHPNGYTTHTCTCH